MSTDAVVIGLGSNLHGPLENLRNALAEIKKIPDVQVLNVSTIYESAAQVPVMAPAGWHIDFLNAAVLVQCENLQPPQLLIELKKIEKKLGRTGSESWAPRTIDLDILYWDGLSFNDRDPRAPLTIPHPQLGHRPFALLPLLEVFPAAKIARPVWASGYATQIPFQTRRSVTCFWPKLVGIVNLTTDSFSDGDSNLNLEKISHLIDLNVDIVDIGAESTRPGAKPVSAAEEWQKLKLALDVLKTRTNPQFAVSIDCYKPDVIAKCLQHYDIDYINDVSGLCSPAMQNLVRESGKKIFVMHSISVPPVNDEFISESINPVETLASWWKQKKSQLLSLGIREEQLIFDPGIGFGKTKQQNFFILKNLQQFHAIADPILIGHSRKSYQSLYSIRDAAARDLETALMTSHLNFAYCQFLRVHDLPTQRIAMSFS